MTRTHPVSITRGEETASQRDDATDTHTAYNVKLCEAGQNLRQPAREKTSRGMSPVQRLTDLWQVWQAASGSVH